MKVTKRRDYKVRVLEHYLLKLRAAIASRESLTSDVNHDVSKYGECRWDYITGQRIAGRKIARLDRICQALANAQKGHTAQFWRTDIGVPFDPSARMSK